MCICKTHKPAIVLRDYKVLVLLDPSIVLPPDVTHLGWMLSSVGEETNSKHQWKREVGHRN